MRPFRQRSSWPGPRLGDVVIEAKGVRKAYADNLLMDDVNFMLPRGGIVGVIGPNGAGKTTLFRMIVGQETPDSGTLRIGETVRLAYVDQSRDVLYPEDSVWKAISEGNDLIVHALSAEAAQGVETGDMERRCRAVDAGA